MKQIITVTFFIFFTTSPFLKAQDVVAESDTTQNTKALTGVNLVQNYRLMYLSAYNFDFGNTSVSSNYVGHLNIFSPSLNKRVPKSLSVINQNYGWGFNTGILKINYNQKDSSNRFQNFKENVFISSFDELKDSIKYLKQINNYKVETRSTVWSFYVQPTFELTKAGSTQHVYLHGHAELLASKWTSKTSIININQDTGMFNKLKDTSFLIRSRLSNEISTSSNSISGYFGAGVTFDLQPWEKGNFFFQPTIGVTTNRPSPSSTDVGSSIRQTGTRRDAATTVIGKAWNSFYLVRAYYTHSISDTTNNKGATIIVGMDIRGFFPFYSPQYAAYIGLNVGLDSVIDLIKGTK
jgi:hypothetical protein